MRYGFISRRNPQTVERHKEALKPYKLDEVIVDDFKSDVDILLEKLENGDSLYIEEPPRDISKFAKIHSYTRKNRIDLYVKGERIADIPVIEIFEEFVKIEIAKRIGYTK